ncbi:SIS domain-containing protein [Arthrobacter sp. NamB2]|uniref:SIS domain-containing protein n=1 Tax=Arthrobacter sp. NamB2 TaxID=2576035 RepID=UPI0010C94C85|nr:SIS domain-containing protein [Arthrobacter sp. NamB2]TKV28498.1 SIS domain-containing protein [Arthrobacter sp. NamB2]
MLKFDEDQFLRRAHSFLALQPQIEDIVGGLSDVEAVFLIGSGGTYAAMWPYEHLLRRSTTVPVRSAIAAELVLSGDALLNERSVAVFASASGTTEDVVQCIEYCRARGVRTVGFTGIADSPIAQAVDHALITEPDAWPFDLGLLLFTTRFLSERGEFAGYDKLVNQLPAVPQALVGVAQQAEPVAEAFAERHKPTDFHFVVGSGNLWGHAYLYSMCILEEMQWLHTTRVHGAEFFHGSLELIEPDTSVLLFVGEDETRPLMERVVRFSEKYSQATTVLDTADYPLEGVDDEFRGLLGPLVMDTITSRISKHLEKQRDHSLDLRRYYRVVEY